MNTILQPDDASTQISNVLDNICQQLERSNASSRSFQIFSDTLKCCKSLIVNELAACEEEKGITEKEDLPRLEKKIAELQLQVNAEMQSVNEEKTKCEMGAKNDKDRNQRTHKGTMENIQASLKELQDEYGAKLGVIEEKEKYLHSSLQRITYEFNLLANDHTTEINLEEKEIDKLAQKLEKDETQLTKLQQHYHVVDLNLKSTREEKDALEKVLLMENAANLILIDAATEIQRVRRGKKSRMDTVIAKAKAKKGKGKGGKKKVKKS